MEHELVAILKADVAGYSRLMRIDEEFTITTLRQHREAMADRVAGYRGQVVHTAGDSFLATFHSITDAVDCAVTIQRDLGVRNADHSDDRKVQFRIGLNLGDVIHDGGDIHGDGVNVAARIEALAEAGGICVSNTVHDQIRDRLASACEDLGEHAVKNISTPVRVYRLDAARVTPEADDAPASGVTAPAADAVSGRRPSIAVIPFVNRSGDPEQEYFSDGITEDIITELSRLRALTVIAYNTAASYKGRPVTAQTVGGELDVRYVLNGSVRRSGDRVRITAELADAATGNQLWVERFDRDLEDVFAVQDEITLRIVATLTLRLENAELERSRQKATSSMAAYDYLLRAVDHHHRRTSEDNALALSMVDEAIALDPQYARAFAWKACIIGQAWIRGYADIEEAMPECLENAKLARAIDVDDEECHRILSALYLIQRDFEKCRFHIEKAFSLNPNDPRILSLLGELLTYLGRPEEGAEWLERAIRLDPYRPDGRLSYLGAALHAARRYDEAIAAFMRVTNHDYAHHAHLAACHARLGVMDKARDYAAEVIVMEPGFSVEQYAETLLYRNPDDLDHHREGLIAAGLPA